MATWAGSDTPLHADLEIRIGSQRGDRYEVELNFSGERELACGEAALAPLFPWVSTGEPRADGERLFAALFEDRRLADAWAEARGLCRRRRVRLRLDADEPELHTLPWELLAEPAEAGPGLALAADAETPFSRYLAGAWRPGRPILDRPVRLLVAIASPDGLPPRCAPLDLAAERAALEAACAAAEPGTIEATFLAPPITLSRLAEAVGQGFHLLHLVAHGTFSREQRRAALYLADEAGAVARVPEEEVAAALARLEPAGAADEPPLRLIFLASCQTAERDPDDTFGGLAPSLVAAGVPAVVAMQGQIPVATARELAATFYRRLLAHGQVDLALNEARAAVLTARLHDAELPVLFLRLRDGQLLARRGEVQGQLPASFWRSLLGNLADGRCVPILGPGVTDRILPSANELARRLARDFHCPFPEADLPRIAQFVGAYEPDLPQREILEILAHGFRRRYGLAPEPRRPNLRLSDITRQANWPALSTRSEETEIHHQLADLGLPLYLTTNADNFLTLALEARGRQPRREHLAPRGAPRGRWDLDPPPTPERPVVLHLFGSDEDPASLVVSVDDHLALLARIARDEDNLLPVGVAAQLATKTVLFLGYQVDDLALRVLLHGFLGHLDAAPWQRRRLNVAVQLAPGDDPAGSETRGYLERSFRSASIDLYWGTVHQFIADLHARWEDFRR
jgi:hypothetical protein